MNRQDPRHFARIKQILCEIHELGDADRRAYLDDVCRNDPRLRAEIEGLLLHEQDPSLVRPALANAGETVVSQPRVEPVPSRALEPGTPLGPYRLDRELGSGGMGRVYAATVAGRCPGLDEGTCVALKVVHPHLLEAEGFFKRFLREGEIGRAVRHPNVVRTFNCDQIVQGGTANAFLVMEYVEGQTLRELLVEMERVPEELCRHIAREVCKGLAAIHDVGVIHRDVKPDNVLITADHVVKVMDLGVARLQDEALRLSQTGAFVGSIHYSVPEAFREGGKHVDGRADLHALGLVLYELACGTNPYLADDVPQILQKVLHEEPQRLGDVNPQLSLFFEEVVHCLLAKHPEKRFATADELLRILEEGEDSPWWNARAKSIRTITKRPLRRVRIPRETAVYGREGELAKLRAFYDAAKSGEGCVVLIEGEAGIGKSRLIDELSGRVHRDGEDINFLFGSYPPGGAATAAGGFSTAFREQLGEAGCADYLQATPVLVAAFDALLRGESTPAGEESLNKQSIQTCFVNATRALGAERPTVVLIDDLHFAPDEGRSLFTSLAMAVPGHRVLLIGTTRPGLPDDWVSGLTRLDQTSQLVLQRLGPKDLVQLLKDTLGSERLASELGNQVAVKSDGNPFFVFEILRGLREGQFITQRADGTWVSTGVIDEIQIPSSVLDLVNARVGDLTEEERDLLDVACCWGFEFDPVIVAEACGLSRVPALKRLGQIERQHRLVRSQGRRYSFDHHQVQEALYGRLNEYLREEYHSSLAKALETRTMAGDNDPESLDGALCVDLCEHYLKGGRGEKALRYLDAAQQHLTRGHQFAQVVALGERALAVTDLLTGLERARMMVYLLDHLDALARRTRQEEFALETERLSVEAGDDKTRGEAANALGLVFLRTSRLTEAEASFRRALQLARTLGNKNGEALATANLGTTFQNQSRFPEAREYLERALALNREIGEPRRVARGMVNLGGILHAQGHHPEARDHFERALALSREIGDWHSEIGATGNLGHGFHAQGNLREAREQYERTLALSRKIGDRQSEAIAYVNLGTISQELGDRVQAREAFEECVTVCREIGARYPEGYGIIGQGNLVDEEGDCVEALRLTEQSLVLRREIRHGDGIADSLRQLGDIQRRAGDVEAARTALEEAGALSRDIGRTGSVALAEAMLACLPGADSEAAVLALSEIGEHGDSPQLRWLLHQATGDHSHLEQAKSLLDEQLAKVPEEFHEAMCTNLRVNRETLAAWRAHRAEG